MRPLHFTVTFPKAQKLKPYDLRSKGSEDELRGGLQTERRRGFCSATASLFSSLLLRSTAPLLLRSTAASFHCCSVRR